MGGVSEECAKIKTQRSNSKTFTHQGELLTHNNFETVRKAKEQLDATRRQMQTSTMLQTPGIRRKCRKPSQTISALKNVMNHSRNDNPITMILQTRLGISVSVSLAIWQSEPTSCLVKTVRERCYEWVINVWWM